MDLWTDWTYQCTLRMECVCVYGTYWKYNFRSHIWASVMAQRLKCLPGMRETQIWSLGWEDPLEKEMATHSRTLAWRIPWREEPGRLQSTGLQSQTRLSDFIFFMSEYIISVRCIYLSLPFPSIFTFMYHMCFIHVSHLEHRFDENEDFCTCPVLYLQLLKDFLVHAQYMLNNTEWIIERSVLQLSFQTVRFE